MPRLFAGLEIPARSRSNARHAARRAAGRALDRSGKLSCDAALHRRHRRSVAHEVALLLDGVRRAASRCGSAADVIRRTQAARRRRGGGADPPLLELQAEHERLMQRVGLEPEGRKFTPHVTLARLRDASSHDVAEYLSTRGRCSAAVPGLALRAVLGARLGRRRALRGRGGLSAGRVEALLQPKSVAT